jgi:hypothetical protein
MAAQHLEQDSDMLIFSFYNARSRDQRETQRITSDQIAALKHADKKGQRAATSGSALIYAVLRGLAESIGGMLHTTSKKYAMCDNYGHIADLSSWTDHLPKCSDCGKVITSRHELRSSVPLK